MKMFIHPQKAKLIEESITFLVNEYNKSGRNPKPVIFHSLNVAFYLLKHGYNEKLAIAAILHDLIEDSGIDTETIEKKFGRQIADLIEVVTYNKEIRGRQAQYEDMFNRVIAQGKEAAILKCADLFDNSFYIKLVEDRESRAGLIAKLKCFLDISKPLIGNEKVWQELNDQYQLINYE